MLSVLFARNYRSFRLAAQIQCDKSSIGGFSYDDRTREGCYQKSQFVEWSGKQVYIKFSRLIKVLVYRPFAFALFPLKQRQALILRESFYTVHRLCVLAPEQKLNLHWFVQRFNHAHTLLMRQKSQRLIYRQTPIRRRKRSSFWLILHF